MTVAVKESPSPWRRSILWVVSMTLTAALAGGGPPPEKPTTAHQAHAWRHTRDGWERPRWLTPQAPPRVAPFHPSLAAAFVVLVTAMALVAYEPPRRGHASPQAATA